MVEIASNYSRSERSSILGIFNFIQTDSITSISLHFKHHLRPIPAGLWGLKTKEFFSQFWQNKTMLQALLEWKKSRVKDTDDEFFLKDVIWPRAKQSALIHDAFKCKVSDPPGVSFPCPRMYVCNTLMILVPF